jgi:hypothetical protein
LPPGGSVLAISRSGAYAIRPDGGTRRLGAFSEAGWSPHGLHVVGAEGRRLVAVDPAATVKWTLTSRRRVHHPAWSRADGFAVAYLEGHALKLVAGNGDPATDRVLRRDAAPVTPAWAPHSDRVLTYATTAGALITLDVVTGDVAARARSSAEPILAMAWSADGRRLVAVRSHSVAVLNGAGHVVRTVSLPGITRDVAVHPSGRRVAAVVDNRVVEVGLRESFRRQLFQGTVDGVAWSENGRRLLVGWKGADEWLILGPGRRVRALHGVSREVGAAGAFPRVVAWCCAD